ncbi:unnamed protein product [Rotaria sp. Silwood1]|nr:unnamed protein product [Rotaria sp. Silwood1]
MYEDDDNECLPIPRRSLVNPRVNHFDSDNENSPFEQRQSRLFLNTSTSTDSGVDENIQTSVQLIALYEKTVELAAKNKINAKNAFHFPFVERLQDILDIIAFDDKTDSFHDHHEPNFVKAGSVIDTSAKIYGYRVDALHTETQKLNGSIQEKHEEESNITHSEQIETTKKLTQHIKPKASSYLVTDLSTISLPYEFEFHPCQPSNMCQWPGGVGIDSLYADMISYTMYSSSDFPLINGLINLNNQINKEYDNNDTILDITLKTIYDLNPLREVIKDNEGKDHVLGCQVLREFSFNEDSTQSYIETIDECSIMDSVLMNSLDNHEILDEVRVNDLSEIRDDPSTFYFQELQSAHTFPTTMISMDMTLMHSKVSFVDQIPQLLRDKTDVSEYSYFDSLKLKLFAGPYLWKYTNLLPDIIKSVSISEQQTSTNRTRIYTKRHYKLNLLNEKRNQSLNKLMSVNSWSRKSFKKRKRKILSTTLRQTHKYYLYEKNHYQLKLSRKLRPLTDLSCLNYFPDYNLQNLININENYLIDDENNYNFDPMDYDNPLSEQPQYDFSRPIQYDKIDYDKNFAKIDAKKLQIELYDEYNRQYTNTSNPVSLSTLCIKLIDQGMISYEKDQIVSAFYCMLNNCNKNHLYMKPNSQNDDLIIQKQPFVDSTQLIYSHSIV